METTNSVNVPTKSVFKIHYLIAFVLECYIREDNTINIEQQYQMPCFMDAKNKIQIKVRMLHKYLPRILNIRLTTVLTNTECWKTTENYKYQEIYKSKGN